MIQSTLGSFCEFVLVGEQDGSTRVVLSEGPTSLLYLGGNDNVILTFKCLFLEDSVEVESWRWRK